MGISKEKLDTILNKRIAIAGINDPFYSRKRIIRPFAFMFNISSIEEIEDSPNKIRYRLFRKKDDYSTTININTSDLEQFIDSEFCISQHIFVTVNNSTYAGHVMIRFSPKRIF